MVKQDFPPEWDEERVRRVIEHYEAQSEEEVLAEDEAAFSDEDFEDLERWEAECEYDQELLEKGDYDGLLAFRTQIARERPDDYHAQARLAEALVLAGKYEAAIQFLTPFHRDFPDVEDFNHVLLDALFGQGLSEDDYEWVQRPIVLRMSYDILDSCFEYLKRKRKPRSIVDVHCQFVMRGYVIFSEEDLLEGLASDARFVVDNPTDPFSATVRVARRRRR